MQTLLLQTPGQFTYLDTLPPTAPPPGMALVRVRRIGICGTDLHAYRGRQPFFTYPRILGHELGVVVVALGDDTDRVHIGDRCAVEPYLNCVHCLACRRGKPNCCTSLQVLGVHTDGGMRDYLTVPIDKLHPSDTLTLDQLALVETLAIGAHAVERARPDKADTVLVIGAGPIGLAVLESLRPVGCGVLLADREASRLAFVNRHYPDVNTILADDQPLTSSLQERLGGDLPTLVFDATGQPTSMMRGFDYVAPAGKLVYVGLFQGDVSFNDPLFHRKEITLLASRNALPSTFTGLIGRMERGELDTTPWITHRAQLANVPDQLPRWLDPANGTVKAMIDLDD